MKILAFEFSSPQRRVAAVQTAADGRMLESNEIVDASPGRNSRPLGMVEEALRQGGMEREQINSVAVGLGPGSYTGIRAAIALAQGWQLARDVKLIGISSAECIAAQAQAEGRRGRFLVVIDAQREELYLAEWEITDAQCRQTSTLRLAKPAEIQQRLAVGESVIGPEVTRWFPNGHLVFPSAVALARLARGRADFVPGEKLEPIYLREPSFVKAPPPRFPAEKAT